MTTKSSRLVLFHRLQILFSLLGVVTSVYLLVQHTRLKSGIQESASFCSLGGFADCDVVNSSDFSEIGGVPMASLGIIFYFTCLLLSLLARPQDKLFARAQRPLSALTVVAGFIDTALLVLQIATLKTLCLLCLFTYLCTGGILFSTLVMTEARTWRAKLHGSIFPTYSGIDRFPWPIPVLTLLAWLGMIGAVALVPPYIRIKSQTYSIVENALEQFFRGFKDKPSKKIEVKPEDATFGNSSSHDQLVVFSDFQCPFCKKAAFTLHTWMKQYRHRVHFVFKHFPLDSSCNSGLQKQMHPQACGLAKLGTCANEKGKFWEFHDLVFLDIPTEVIEEGLDPVKKRLQNIFSESEADTCLRSEKAGLKVAADIREGTRLGVGGTPAVYLNGKQITIPLTLENLNRLLEIEDAPAG